MALKGNREWLQRSLGNVLGWDSDMVLGVSDAIATAESREEVDTILQDYLGGGKEVHSIVQRFLGETTKQAAPSAPQQQGPGSDQLTQAGKVRGSSRPAAARERPAGSMTIKHTQKRKGAQAAAAETDAPALDRAVANCLCCGKVYMCRETTKDASLFVESGGVCTFCGAKVALSSQESSHARPPYAERVAAPASQEQPASSAPAGSAVDDSAAEAVALKNRLVDYDRNAAKRTTVVDDQSDFFEIDSNAWLSDEERQQLKERQRAIEEAEQSRRRAVTVTFDLLGRQVIMTGDEQPVSTSDTEASSAAGPFAAANTSAQPPQSVGPSAHTGVDEDRHAQDTPRVLRIRPNPTLHGPAPVFMRRTNGPEKGVAQPSGRQQRPSNGQLQNRDAGRLQHDDAFVASFGALSVSS